jgi:hypothetical protein
MGVAGSTYPEGSARHTYVAAWIGTGLQRACHSDPLSVTELSEKDCAEVLFIAIEGPHDGLCSIAELSTAVLSSTTPYSTERYNTVLSAKVDMLSATVDIE